MRVIPIVLSATFSLGLAGCLTSGGTVYHVDDPYRFLAYAAGKGGVPVMVVGGSQAGRPQAEQAAIRALQSQFPSQAAAFQAAPAKPGEGTKIVVMLDAGHPQPEDVCRDPTQIATVADTGVSRAGVVYCGVGPYSEAWVKIQQPAAPGSTEFAELVEQAVNDGVPRRMSPQRELGDQPPD